MTESTENPDVEASVNAAAQETSEAAPTTFHNDDPLNFRNFAPKLPLLVERPSAYLHRLARAAEELMQVSEGKPLERVILEPSIVLPFFSLYGDERFSKDTIRYPFFHMPQNHPYDESCTPEVYFLTMYVAYTEAGIIHEPGNGDLYTLGIDNKEFTIDEAIWQKASAWAEANAQALADLNIARIITFSADDASEEEPAGILLNDVWELTDDRDTLLDKGRTAAALLESTYGEITETPFKPFDEE